MQLFGHPLQLVMLDVDGVILDLMAGFERHLGATTRQLHLPTEPIRDDLRRSTAARATALPVSRRRFKPGGRRSINTTAANSSHASARSNASTPIH